MKLFKIIFVYIEMFSYFYFKDRETFIKMYSVKKQDLKLKYNGHKNIFSCV